VTDIAPSAATESTTSDTIPTLCEGRRCSTGKAKPVTLVASRLSRKIAVHPARSRPRSSPIMTMRPQAMPTRLNATWSSVKVDVVMPQII